VSVWGGKGGAGGRGGVGGAGGQAARGEGGTAARGCYAKPAGTKQGGLAMARHLSGAGCWSQ
jgi:hypothetical protein